MKAGDQSPQHAAKQPPAGGENNWLDEIKDLYYDYSGDTAFSPNGKLLRKANTLPGAGQ